MLWLLVRDMDHPAVGHLRREAVRRGVDARRLVFATTRPNAQYLGLYRHADLFQHIREQGTLPEEVEEKLRSALEEFKEQFSPSSEDGKAPKEAEAGELEDEEEQEKMKKKVRRKPSKKES